MREDTIEICHLKKAYGEHVIFSNLTMELKKGAVTCLMAPSGAGKTTLLRILAGLEQADGGKIGGLEALRKSMVFQEPRLAEELTAAANIQLSVRHRMFGKEKRSFRHLVEEMEELGLSGCENQAVSELSGCASGWRFCGPCAWTQISSFWMSRSGDWMRGRKRKR